MNNMPAPLSYQQAIMPIDPGAIAAAESVKARIQSAYVMAFQRPRSEEQSRARILEACKRPEFAVKAEYSKPVGNTKIIGPSIRLAELAVRCWGNINVETQVVYEDREMRRVKVTILDLETNATFGKEIQIRKTVERRDGKGREIVGERTNTYGDKVFVVLATDDELHNKEAAMISKVIRNEGLRLIPQDIVDEAILTARKTLNDRDAKDPQAAKKAVMDAFSSIGIKPRELEKYLGHSLDVVSPAEIQDLRGVYAAINGGEATWADYVAPKADEGDDLNAKVKAAAKKAKETPPAKQEEPAQPKAQSQAAQERPMVKCPIRMDGDGNATEIYAEVCESCDKAASCPGRNA